VNVNVSATSVNGAPSSCHGAVAISMAVAMARLSSPTQSGSTQSGQNRRAGRTGTGGGVCVPTPSTYLSVTTISKGKTMLLP
jgi:hypothetical protein